MARHLLVGLLLAAALLIVVLLPRANAELGKAGLPSPIIFPTQQIPLSFSHTRHLERDKMDCAYCHEDTPDSTSAADNNIPKEEACASCHEIDRSQPDKEVAQGEPGAKCSLCHPGWHGPDVSAEPPRVIVPTPNLKFNHKVHIDRKVRCQTCHGDLLADKVGLATRAQLPHMPLCLTCHDSKTAPAKCTTCHIGEVGGYVKTEFAEGTLMPTGVLRGDAHDLRFRTEHARVAANDQKYCANCHKKDFCVDCHNGVEKPMDFHGGDYVNQHPIDARRNNPDCGACHRRETFCTGCHARTGVSPDPKTSEFDRQTSYYDWRTGEVHEDKNRLFHPKGWVTTITNTASGTHQPQQERWTTHHSFQAQRNIRTCASCHREEFCLDCHSGGIGGQNINPHPANFGQSKKCEALRQKNGRMCLKCHPTPDDALCE